jgi:Retroviral aspartyl protease
MQIVGHWWQGDDGVTRPVVEINVSGSDGKLHSDRFLIDSGADCTALSSALMDRLQLPARQPDANQLLLGIGGSRRHRWVNAALEFLDDTGRVIRVRGEVAGFIDSAASEMSILGRDILNNFDVILSRRRADVLLLAPNHKYQVVS